MKKLSLLFVIIVSLFIPFVVKADSLNVKTLEATLSDNTITVKGTVDDGVLAVAVMIYDSTETDVIKFETTSVNEDNTFEYKITVDKTDNYVVKAANYDGGDYVTYKLADEDIKNPKTFDNIIFYVVLFAIAVSGFVITKKYFKKKIK